MIRRARVHRGSDIDRGAERRIVGLHVVGRLDRIHFQKADSREARDDPGCHPLARRVYHLCAGRHRDAAASGDDAAVADDHGAALDRLRAVTQRHGAAGDRDGLR
jgi:hypothetical protein